MNQRERFEAWATAPPREWSVERHAHGDFYIYQHVQAAAHSWIEAERQTEERCAEIAQRHQFGDLAAEAIRAMSKRNEPLPAREG